MSRLGADETRRESMQGFGKPIIGMQWKGYQFVGVGNKLHYGKNALGPEWGTTELQKPAGQRHRILQWNYVMTLYQNSLITAPGKIHSAPMTGAAAAYYGLAYNLYLLEHNVELQRRLIGRLKNSEQFHAAYYETFVAASFILAGFELEMEDEGNPNTTHCEFSAKSKSSGKTYSVEAKSRAPNKAHLDVGNQPYAALCKDASHERIVFIDVNILMDKANTEEKWLAEIVPAVKNREPKMTIRNQPAPPTFVVVTNHPYHHDLDSVEALRAAFALGFKIEDFGVTAKFNGCIPACKAKQKYADVFSLMGATRNYRIPSTFDGEIGELAFGEVERRWVIGQQYDLSEFEPGAVGVLTHGVVVVENKTAHLAFICRRTTAP